MGYAACAPCTHGVRANVITIIENGRVFAPEPLGQQSVLLLNGFIEKIGEIDRGRVEALGLEYEVVDADGCVICPGLIDPHQHVLGGSGERGFSSMTPEIFAEELVQSGVTTVVGCLGVDVTMKNMMGLVGKVKGLREQGLDVYAWTGGYRVPPSTLLENPREDILFVGEIIGVGEIAISDERSMDPDPTELAKIAHDAYDGGMLAGKCGLTHFHVGDHESRLAPLRNLIDKFSVRPCWLYATHIERSDALMKEAIALSHSGVNVDIDIVNEDLSEKLRFFIDNGGNTDCLSISSDAAISSPHTLYEQIRSAVKEHHFKLDQVLKLATENPARIMKLQSQGRLEQGKRADLLVLDEDSLDIVHVHARNGWMLRDGSMVAHSSWLDGNKREIHLVGTEAGAS
jgi:beta-aspartyl-dipeptidase (metallo-type)